MTRAITGARAGVTWRRCAEWASRGPCRAALTLLDLSHSLPGGRGKAGAAAGGKKKPVSRSVKAGLQFPVGRMARYMCVGRGAGCGGALLLSSRDP